MSMSATAGPLAHAWSGSRAGWAARTGRLQPDVPARLPLPGRPPGLSIWLTASSR